MKLHTLLPSPLHMARWWTRFRALLRRWSRPGRAGELADPAWRLRFHPIMDQLEDRFYPGDPFGLQYAALWGAGAGLLLPSLALTGNAGDPGLPGTGEAS